MRSFGKKHIIYVTSGVGEGKTNISAFDQALVNAGIGNYNLIYLSSIIPKNFHVTIKRLKSKEVEYGNKLYVVISHCDQNTFGKEAWAGLGWIQDKEDRGLFVEHKAENKKNVVMLIKNSLSEMRRSRPYKYGKIRYATASIKCKHKLVCAVVAAVYQSKRFT